MVVTSSSYVSSALHLLELRRTRGIVLDVIGTDATGAVDLDALESALLRPAALVAAAHVPTSSGLVEPVHAIGALAGAAGVPFLLDATQSLGHLPTDVSAIGCQVLVGTGRKFLAAATGCCTSNAPARGTARARATGRPRMIRRAYSSPVWDGLVERAYAGWADLERESGRTLLTPTGGLYAHPAGAEGLRGPGCVVVDHLRAAEIAPGLALGPEFVAVHDPAAGVLAAEGALAALAELGRRYGVQRRDETPVLGWEPDGDGVVVRTADGDVRARRLVLCAGPWTGELVPGFAGLL